MRQMDRGGGLQLRKKDRGNNSWERRIRVFTLGEEG